MQQPQPYPVDDGAFAVRTLQIAYDVSRLLEAMAAAPSHALTAKALAGASVSLCQGVLCARVDDYEHEVVRAMAGHLGRAADTFSRQGSATADMARADVGRALGMLRRMDEVDWEMADELLLGRVPQGTPVAGRLPGQLGYLPVRKDA